MHFETSYSSNLSIESGPYNKSFWHWIFPFLHFLIIPIPQLFEKNGEMPVEKISCLQIVQWVPGMYLVWIFTNTDMSFVMQLLLSYPPSCKYTYTTNSKPNKFSGSLSSTYVE